MLSQNGYKAGDSSLIASYTVPGTTVRISLRKGDASVVLLHFAAWFNKNIQPLQQKDTGGYNPRLISGSKSAISNHASGTAEDLRWNAHPLGAVHTFTNAQVSAIHGQLKFYEGVIRWGGDYTGRKDEMHFEINKGPKDLARIAKKCKAPVKVPTPPKPAQLVVDGELGSKTISRWQQIMHTPVDGKIDENDSELIRAVQRRLQGTVDHRIQVDGKLGPKTIGGLQRYLQSPVDQHISKPKSQMVMALQRRLNTGKF